VEIEQQLVQLRDEASLGDHKIMSTSETLYLDKPLIVSTSNTTHSYDVTLYFGVQHKPQQRLKLVCRNASTALIIRYAHYHGTMMNP
jgi:hypothetical protein